MFFPFVVIIILIASPPLPAASATKLTKAQAEQQCRAELDSFDGEKRRSRTGYSFEKDVELCIKQKTGR